MKKTHLLLNNIMIGSNEGTVQTKFSNSKIDRKIKFDTQANELFLSIVFVIGMKMNAKRMKKRNERYLT
jgi:hypothetical protein